MTIQTFYSETLNPPLTRQVREIPLQQQNELIHSALQCLENRMKYHSQLASSADVHDYLRLHLAQEKNEIFAALFLDTQHRVLAFEKLFQGTVDSTSVHPRVVIQRTLVHNAAAVIFAHNHPSGSVEPSTADKEITGQLIHVLDIIDVRVLDHFIVSCEGIFSFAECGLL